MNLKQRDALLRSLESRFHDHMQRHVAVSWPQVLATLEGNADALRSLGAMEASGGEPDVIGRDGHGRLVFCDCSPESPGGRRSLCYDGEALDSRKENKPEGSAVGMAATMGIELLTEQQYAELQQLGEFDTKTSSWIATPADVRSRGGALFCDRRYGRVSCITTERSRTTRRAGSGAGFAYERASATAPASGSAPSRIRVLRALGRLDRPDRLFITTDVPYAGLNLHAACGTNA